MKNINMIVYAIADDQSIPCLIHPSVHSTSACACCIRWTLSFYSIYSTIVILFTLSMYSSFTLHLFTTPCYTRHESFAYLSQGCIFYFHSVQWNIQINKQVWQALHTMAFELTGIWWLCKWFAESIQTAPFGCKPPIAGTHSNTIFCM